jgi:hypothetical protein
MIFRLTAEAERDFSPARVVKWALSIWLWPFLLLASRRR